MNPSQLQDQASVNQALLRAPRLSGREVSQLPAAPRSVSCDRAVMLSGRAVRRLLLTTSILRLVNAPRSAGSSVTRLPSIQNPCAAVHHVTEGGQANRSPADFNSNRRALRRHEQKLCHLCIRQSGPFLYLPALPLPMTILVCMLS